LFNQAWRHYPLADVVSELTVADWALVGGVAAALVSVWAVLVRRARRLETEVTDAPSAAVCDSVPA
jgi:hypothetical protein